MVVSHLSNRKMFLGGDPCRNKYAVYKQKKHDIVALDEGVFYINTQQEKADDKHHLKKKKLCSHITHWRKAFTFPKLYNNQNNGTIQC